MDPTDVPFYFADKSLPVGSQPLPPNTRCKLCACHPANHVLYWKCPLLGDFICSSCCQEDVPKQETLLEIQKHINGTTFDQVKKVCGDCKKNCLQNP